MRCVAEPRCWLAVFRFALLASISVTAVACSTDTHRFDSNPFGDRAQSSREVTGSVPQAQSNRHAADPVLARAMRVSVDDHVGQWEAPSQ